MMIDRRAFATGLAAGVAEWAALPLGAGAANATQSASFRLPSREKPRALARAYCDSWLLRFTGGAPRLILHENTGLMFRPSPAEGAATMEAQGLWRDYDPPYPLLSLSPGKRGQAPLLGAVPPPAARASSTLADPEESAALVAAAADVVDHCLAAERPGAGDVWLLVRPTLRFGERRIRRAAPGGYAGRDAQSYPMELRAKLDPRFRPPHFVRDRTDPASA